MSVQLEVVRFRDLIEVLSIPRFVPGTTPPALEIKGEDFRSVERVVINDQSSPEFIIINKKTIYVQIPEAIKRIKTIEVLSSNFTRSTSSSKLSYEIGPKTRKVEGILKLMQLFIKQLLQTPGSDIFNPERGGGLLTLVGAMGTGRGMNTIVGSVSRAVQTTVSQMRSSQINVPGLPLSEQLLSAEVTDFDIFERQMEARVKVLLVSMAGKEAVTALEL
jgi:hypothetical protein